RNISRRSADAVIQPPHSVGDTLTQMPENDVQLRIMIEQSTTHQPECMHRGLNTERPGGTHKPRMSLIYGLTVWEWIARMQIQRHIQFFNFRPEWPITKIVQINHCVGIADLREAVHHGSLKAEIFDAPRQFDDRRIRILHRQSRKSSEPIGPFR